MIPMARRACGRREIAVFEVREMDAGTILLQLIGRDAVLGHSLGVGMTMAAGVWNMRRIDRSRRIFHRADIVNAMTVDARRHVSIARRQALAMHAGLIQL